MGLFRSKQQKAQAYYEMGENCYNQKMYSKMLRHYEKAAALGHLQSMHCLGYAYLHGEGVDQDYSKALEWFSMAADQGYGKSQVAAARICYEGHLGAPNYGKAMEYFKGASEQGYIYAMAYYGKLLMEFGKTEADKAEGFKQLVSAALQDSSDALGFLTLAMNKRYAVETWETGRVQVVDTVTEDVIAYKEHGNIGFYMTYAEASQKKAAASDWNIDISAAVQEALEANTGVGQEVSKPVEPEPSKPTYVDKLFDSVFSENVYVDETIDGYYEKALTAYAKEDYVTAYKWAYRIFPGKNLHDSDPEMKVFKAVSKETKQSYLFEIFDTYDEAMNGKAYTVSYEDVEQNCVACDRCTDACPQVFKKLGNHRYVDQKACTPKNKLRAYGAYKDCPTVCINFDEY